MPTMNRLCQAYFAIVLLIANGAPIRAQPPRGENDKTASGPVDYTSPNFLVHTDLPKGEAKDLLERLETMLKLISAYWGRPSRGVIECYVVRDLKNWPPGSIPSEDGLAKIQEGAGVTITQTASLGRDFVAKAIVYAVADRGTPQHEAVHAYCGQAFGTTGPVWYAEGMAEMGQYWKAGDSSVQCHPGVLQYLKEAPPKSLNEIVNAREFTGDSWQNYAWRWALCHLLANNKNYADRFRPLGLSFLEKRPTSFEEVYGAMASEICFEYLFFLKHFDLGYRADLCSWDWKKKFIPLKGAAPVTVKVDANRGWQPTGIVAAEGDEFEYAATGTWKTSKDKSSTAVSADGAESGEGRLVGMVMKDFDLAGSLDLAEYLSEPFDLGVHGSFTVPQAGKLYLRCQDAWNGLADNSGKLTVKLKAKGKGNPLPRPKSEKAKSKSEPAEAPMVQ
jgi:hypothetical protein